MVKIRLARGGVKKSKFYKIVVTDSRNARNGRFIERVGFLNKIGTGKAESMSLEGDRIEYWIGKGARVSKSVYTLMKVRGSE